MDISFEREYAVGAVFSIDELANEEDCIWPGLDSNAESCPDDMIWAFQKKEEIQATHPSTEQTKTFTQ